MLKTLCVKAALLLTITSSCFVNYLQSLRSVSLVTCLVGSSYNRTALQPEIDKKHLFRNTCFILIVSFIVFCLSLAFGHCSKETIAYLHKKIGADKLISKRPSDLCDKSMLCWPPGSPDLSVLGKKTHLLKIRSHHHETIPSFTDNDHSSRFGKLINLLPETRVRPIELIIKSVIMVVRITVDNVGLFIIFHRTHFMKQSA